LTAYEKQLAAWQAEMQTKAVGPSQAPSPGPTDPGTACGSVEKYKETHQWEDLPGCPGGFKKGTGEWDTRESLLRYAKDNFARFYEKWKNYRMGDEDMEGLVHECVFFKHPGATSKWSQDSELASAALVYQEEAEKVKKALSEYKKNWEPVLKKISSRYFYCETNVMLVNQKFEELKGKRVRGEVASSERELLRGDVEAIRPLLKEAEDLKIPETMPVAGSGRVKETTLGAIRNVLLQQWEAVSAEADKKAREAYEKQLEPYLKLMSGDKAKMFRKWYGLKIYGKGGRCWNHRQPLPAQRFGSA
jgi:hypothetical protein